MPNVTVQARINPDLKKEAETILSEIGMTTAEAFRVFLKQVVNSGGLPFQPTVKVPNTETQAAILKLEKGDGQIFQSAEELFSNWDN